MIVFSAVYPMTSALSSKKSNKNMALSKTLNTFIEETLLTRFYALRPIG
jgi:hypothetical protein